MVKGKCWKITASAGSYPPPKPCAVLFGAKAPPDPLLKGKEGASDSLRAHALVAKTAAHEAIEERNMKAIHTDMQEKHHVPYW